MVAVGRVDQACVLTFADWSAGWADPLADIARATCQLRGRTGFWSDVLEGGSPGLGCIVAYAGPNVGRFFDEFHTLGLVSFTLSGLCALVGEAR